MSSKNEIDIFVPLEEIETIKNEKVKVPKVSWKKETEISKILAGCLKTVLTPGLLEKAENISPTDIIKLLPNLSDNFLPSLTKVVSIILEKDTEWIENNLDSEKVVELILPFFAKLSKLRGKIQEALKQKQSQ